MTRAFLVLLCGCEWIADIPRATVVDASTDGPAASCVTGEIACAPPTPACNTDTGTCVECVGDGDCGGTVCELATSTCEGCRTDGECPSGACLADHSCAEEARVLYVAVGGAGDCSKAAPCALEVAVPLLGVGRDVVQLAPGVHLPVAQIAIMAPAIFNGSSDGEAVIRGPSGMFALTYSGMAMQFHRHAIEAPAGGIGVQCQAAGQLSLVGMDLRASGAAVFSNACLVEITRSKLSRNDSFAMSIVGGTLTMTNSFVTNNGNMQLVGALLLDSLGPDSRLEHVTIAGNRNDGTQESAMRCTNNVGAGPTFHNALIHDNSIPAACTVSNSAIDAGYLGPGINNILVEPAFVDEANDDYHLVDNAAVAGLGQPTTLTIDFDSEQRPRPGTAPDFGADEID